MTSCSLLPETRKQRNRFLFPSWFRPRTEPQALTVKPLKQTCKWNHINKQAGLTWALKSGGICAIRGLNCRQREFWHRHLSVRQCFMLSRCTTTLLFYKTTPVRFRAESQVWWQLSVQRPRPPIRRSVWVFASAVYVSKWPLAKYWTPNRCTSLCHQCMNVCVWMAECWLLCCTAPWVVVKTRKALYKCGPFNQHAAPGDIHWSR